MQSRVNMLFMVMVTWTLTSFTCHYTAKLFLRASNVTNDTLTGLAGSLVITGVQLVFCVVLTKCNTTTEVKDNTLRLIQIAHALATLATNFSMAVTHASSTFAIKLMAPMTGALAQKIILGTKLSYIQYASLPVIVFGSVLFAEDISHGLSVSLGTILAFTSNILLALRNVFIKKQHLDDKSLTLTNRINWMTLLIAYSSLLLCTEGLALASLLPKSVVDLEVLVMVSALFHVAYSYISTTIVLAECSVVEHSLCNIVKRLSVVGLLFATGRRMSTTWNVYGLILCAAGLTMYYSSKLTATSVVQFLRSSKRLVILLIAALSVCTLLVYEYPDSAYIPELLVSGRQRFENVVKNISSNRTLGGVLTDIRDPYLSGHWYSGDTDSNSTRYTSYKPGPDSVPPLSMEDALRVDLVENPELADAISPYLTNRAEVVAEAQRIHMNIFTKLLAGRKRAMLFHYSPSENKGDSAIAVGEFILLRKLKVDIIHHCPLSSCLKSMNKALSAKGNLTNKDLIIILHGGGNVIGYPKIDHWRHDVINNFPDFDIVMFPQSIYLRGSQDHIKFCKEIYASHASLTFLWRDRGSYKLGKELFPKVRSLLSPDIAYQIGSIPRTMTPSYQIIWIKRTDDETPGYEAPGKIEGLSFLVYDWLSWPTPKGSGPMEDTFLMTQVGLTFLQRGRMVVTDRLHGHILSTLLGIPHVFIDNKEHKISNYHNTWTRSLDNLVYTNSSSEAVIQAKLLLMRIGESLPPVIAYGD